MNMTTKEVVFDLDAAAFSSDDFRMYQFKVKRCPRARPHDWTQCPFAHPGEKAKRRDPRRYRYSGTACPEFRRNGSCRRGDACPFAHGVFECWLHPSRYRTQMCTDGANCKRRVCFFAHTEDELRKPEDDPVWLQQQLQAELAAEQQVQQQVQALKIFAALLGPQGGSSGSASGASNSGTTAALEQLLSKHSPSTLASLLGLDSSQIPSTAALPATSMPGQSIVGSAGLDEQLRQLSQQLQPSGQGDASIMQLLNFVEKQAAASQGTPGSPREGAPAASSSLPALLRSSEQNSGGLTGAQSLPVGQDNAPTSASHLLQPQQKRTGSAPVASNQLAVALQQMGLHGATKNMESTMSSEAPAGDAVSRLTHHFNLSGTGTGPLDPVVTLLQGNNYAPVASSGSAMNPPLPGASRPLNGLDEMINQMRMSNLGEETSQTQPSRLSSEEGASNQPLPEGVGFEGTGSSEIPAEAHDATTPDVQQVLKSLQGPSKDKLLASLLSEFTSKNGVVDALALLQTLGLSTGSRDHAGAVGSTCENR